MPEYRRRLPHIHPVDAYLFLTWRLWGSLPSRPPSRLYPTLGHAFVAADRALGRNPDGPHWLQDPRLARLVMQTILAGEQERQFHELLAWAIMPNHVHLLILPKVAVSAITRWLKGSTARRANHLLRRTGRPFWQDESYDHWVRNRQERDRIIAYIESNPVAAGQTGHVRRPMAIFRAPAAYIRHPQAKQRSAKSSAVQKGGAPTRRLCLPGVRN